MITITKQLRGENKYFLLTPYDFEIKRWVRFSAKGNLVGAVPGSPGSHMLERYGRRWKLDFEDIKDRSGVYVQSATKKNVFKKVKVKKPTKPLKDLILLV